LFESDNTISNVINLANSSLWFMIRSYQRRSNKDLSCNTTNAERFSDFPQSQEDTRIYCCGGFHLQKLVSAPVVILPQKSRFQYPFPCLKTVQKW